jgi:hypothetical protein
MEVGVEEEEEYFLLVAVRVWESAENEKFSMFVVLLC